MILRTLYICYFGLREPLVQTQVLPYLRQLSATGLEVNLLTFEPKQSTAWSREEVEGWRARLKADGIRWLSLPYHKRPTVPATAYDILWGACEAVRLVRREGIEVIHARSHVPLAMGLLAQRLTGCRLIFDLRGLMAEEYADAGIWKPESLPFRMIKRLERVGIHRSDQIVVLTRRMRDWLIEHGLAGGDKIEVIPCCVDFSRFAERDAEQTESSSARFEVVYAGSVTGLYLLEEMGRFFLAVRALQPNAYLRILTKSPAQEAAAVLERAGVNPNDFWIGAVPPGEVAVYFRQAGLALSFRKPTFSQIAASPTKIPEYLAAGLPVVSNSGVGDINELLERERVGVIVKDFNDEEYTRMAERALLLANDPEIHARCVRVARERFDLAAVGRVGYRNVYRRIAEQAALGNMELNAYE